mmetsp:Transcript_21363/g.55626  ORF Transcript_21363/g.55626 Transcript_21363/m.55626 type:complete len:225 (+) Transcript_21363:482-1156(+)
MEESTEGVSGEEARPYKEGEIALKEGYPGLRCRRVGETSGDVCWDACWLPAAAALACRSARSCRRRAATSWMDLARLLTCWSPEKVHMKEPRSSESMRQSQMGQPKRRLMRFCAHSVHSAACMHGRSRQLRSLSIHTLHSLFAAATSLGVSTAAKGSSLSTSSLSTRNLGRSALFTLLAVVLSSATLSTSSAAVAAAAAELAPCPLFTAPSPAFLAGLGVAACA